MTTSGVGEVVLGYIRWHYSRSVEVFWYSAHPGSFPYQRRPCLPSRCCLALGWIRSLGRAVRQSEKVTAVISVRGSFPISTASRTVSGCSFP